MTQPHSALPSPFGGRSVLIIDDTPDDVALLVEFLRRTDLRIAVALNGNEGAQKAQVLRPDLILLDVRMPQVDGFATCRLLKANPLTRDIPVIFLSGAADIEDRLTGLQLGAVDYVTKPFSADEVLARIRIHLEIANRLAASPPVDVDGLPTDRAAHAAGGGINSRVAAAMNELLKDIGHPPAMPELARSVGISEKRLNELFREATGSTVFNWLREQRFRLACRLLAESELEIQQIADHVGYGSAGNFAAMFRERLGVTPREYRQTRRGQQA